MADKPKERQGAREQEDVLQKKDHTTSGSRGLQQWGEQDGDGSEHAEGLTGHGRHGNASMGTAERQAHIGGLAPGAPKNPRALREDEDE